MTDTDLDLRNENEELKARLAKLEAALLDNPPKPKRTGPLPRYRLLKPFYGPNDRYYDPEEGDEIIDWSGAPNASMEPLNEQAHERMAAWLAGLPGEGTLDVSYMAEAAALLRPKHGDEERPLAEFAGMLTAKAIELRNAAEGRKPTPYEISVPHKPEKVRVMGAKKTNLSEEIDVVPQPPKPRGRPKQRIFGSGENGITETAIEIG